jgi:hypothetical protein
MKQIFSPARRQLLTGILTFMAVAFVASFTSRHADKLSLTERLGVVLVIGALFGLCFWLMRRLIRRTGVSGGRGSKST